MSSMEKDTVEVSTNIHKPADKVSLRHGSGLSCVQAMPATGGGVWLTATDGRIMAITEAASSIRKTTLVPADACKGATKRKPLLTRLVEGVWERPNKKDIPRAAIGPFPPCARTLDAVKPDGESLRVLCLDADLLHKLADAITPIGDQKIVKLLLDTSQDEIEHATGVVGANGIGVLMSCLTDAKKAVNDFESCKKRYCDDARKAD